MNTREPQRILITGASGLVGNALVERLANHARVIALVRDSVPDLPKEVEVVRFDLRQSDVPLLNDVPETVVHLAQSPRYREFPDGAAEVFEIGVAATHRLLAWARQQGVQRFVYASSGGIYGHGDMAFEEDAPVVGPAGPLSHYLTTKHCGELLTESYGNVMIVIILRFFFVYGRRQRRDMLIRRLVDCVAEGCPIVLQGEDGIRINPIHVNDAAAAVAAACDLSESHKINIAGAEILTLRRIGEIIGEQVGRSPRFELQVRSLSRI